MYQLSTSIQNAKQNNTSVSIEEATFTVPNDMPQTFLAITSKAYSPDYDRLVEFCAEHGIFVEQQNK